MNERIKQLAEQAREFATTRHPVSNIILSVNSDLFEQKFAELIISECANAIVNDSRLSDVRTARNGCVRAIKEHFGVE